jgi:hypothetical protein
MSFDQLGTLLVINGLGVTPYSSRGLTQTLTPIEQSKNTGRTVNGELVDLSDELFQKYSTQITCNDQRVPALDGVWPGKQIVIDCVIELAYLTAGGSPARPVVAGSSRIEGDYTFYRPQLTARIMDYTTNEDEWGRVSGWSLTAEEV